MPLTAYISFAYKQSWSPDQFQEVSQNLPKWATSSYFSINARAPGTPSKDQLRLMVRSLLEDRFKLKLHFETSEHKAAVLQMAGAGTLGPYLKPYAPGQSCGTDLTSGPLASIWKAQEVYPGLCGHTAIGVGRSNTRTMAGRAVGMGGVVSSLSIPLGETVVDKTGLSGIFDFLIAWEPAPAATTSDSDRELDVASVVQAVKKQLGLTINWQKTQVTTLKIDHIEELKEN